MNAQSDPLAAYRINKAPAQESALLQPTQNDPLDKYRIKKAEGAPFIYETGRHAARIGSRIAEAVGGIPGDVESLLESGIFAGLDKLTGLGKPKGKTRELPTTGELKEFSEKATGGLTKPQGDIEKAGDEFVQTAVSLLGPGKFRKALGVAAGAQLAKEGLKVGGLGEGSQEAGKIGTMLFLSMLNPGGALKYASNQYDKANQLSKGASITAKSLEKNLQSFTKDLKQGVTTSSKNAVLKPAEELLSKINNGKIGVQELTAAKRDLNTIMKDPALLKREKKLLKVLGREIDTAIKPFEKINPEFSKAYRPANEIYGAVAQGTKASDFISKTLGAKSFFGTLAAEGALGHPEYILPTVGITGASIAGARTLDFATRLSKSPELQKFYTKAMVAALAEDAPALRLYSDKIERALQKSGELSRSIQ
jgi:hypothetical protein